MSILINLTNNDLYTFTNKGNASFALDLDDNNYTVIARPEIFTTTNQLIQRQQWRAATYSRENTSVFSFQNVYSTIIQPKISNSMHRLDNGDATTLDRNSINESGYRSFPGEPRILISRLGYKTSIARLYLPQLLSVDLSATAMVSFLYLTDGTIYAFRNKWNPDLVLHLDDDNFTVSARSFVNLTRQQWRAHTADSNHFHLQNMYTDGYLKYSFSNTSAFCSDTTEGLSVWALQNFPFGSNGTLLIELISENGNTVFIPYCDTTVIHNCSIQTGPAISDANHAWVFQPLG